MEKEKKSRIVIEFDNPKAKNILKTCALLSRGMTMKGMMTRLIAKWLMEDCKKTMAETEQILGYKF